MGERERKPVTMGALTLELTLFGTAFFVVTMVAIQTVPFIIFLPDSRAGIGWLAYLIMLPTIVTGIFSGLTAALGAYVGRRVSTTIPHALSERTRMTLGAGVGGALGSALFLLYLSWFYQSSGGLIIGVLGFIVVFGAFTGFTALGLRRRTPAAT